jgi:hypothetical protein
VIRPVAEAGLAHVTMVTEGAVFTPEDRYGAPNLHH